MYNALIDNGVTFLFSNSEDQSFDKKNILAMIMNRQGVKRLMIEIPIERFFIKDQNDKIIEISTKQAFEWYDKLMEYHLEKNAEKERKI